MSVSCPISEPLILIHGFVFSIPSIQRTNLVRMFPDVRVYASIAYIYPIYMITPYSVNHGSMILGSRSCFAMSVVL